MGPGCPYCIGAGTGERAGCGRLVGEALLTNKVLIVAAALVAVFLLGFVPEAVKASRLDSELRASRDALAGAELRDLAGLAYVQANQKNYGLAAQTASRFFGRAREVANQTEDAARKKAIEDLLAPRDRITAELAKGDAAVIGDLQDLFLKTRSATGAGS